MIRRTIGAVIVALIVITAVYAIVVNIPQSPSRSEPETQGLPPPSVAGPTKLTIGTFSPISVKTATHTLSCDPPRGGVADAATLCRLLRERPELMLPQQEALACPGAFHSTTVRVEGLLDGKRVESRFPFCRDERTRLWRENLLLLRSQTARSERESHPERLAL